MHLIQDENGKPIPHGTDHTHDHGGAACDSAHCASADTCSVKDSGSCPSHQGRGSAHSMPEPKTPQQEYAVLDYMLKHNQSHAAELDRLAAQIEANGHAEAAQQLKKASDEMMKSNLYLSLALSLVKEQQ